MKVRKRIVYECECCGKQYETIELAESCESRCKITDAEALSAYQIIKDYCAKHNNYCEYKGEVCALYNDCRVRDIGGYNAIKQESN